MEARAWMPTPIARRASARRDLRSPLLVGALDRSSAALASPVLRVTAVPERPDRVGAESLIRPPPGEERTYVRLKCGGERPVGAEHVPFCLRRRKDGVVDQERLRVRRLDVH